MYGKKEKKAPMSERQQMALLKAITAGKIELSPGNIILRTVALLQ